MDGPSLSEIEYGLWNTFFFFFLNGRVLYDTGLLDSTTTLHVCQLGDTSLLQVHPDGIRLIREDKRINEWKPPGKFKIWMSNDEFQLDLPL